MTARNDILALGLQLLETIWLQDTPFVSGSNICIADLLMVTELEMLRVLSGAKEVMPPSFARRAYISHVTFPVRQCVLARPKLTSHESGHI